MIAQAINDIESFKPAAISIDVTYGAHLAEHERLRTREDDGGTAAEVLSEELATAKAEVEETSTALAAKPMDGNVVQLWNEVTRLMAKDLKERLEFNSLGKKYRDVLVENNENKEIKERHEELRGQLMDVC